MRTIPMAGLIVLFGPVAAGVIGHGYFDAAQPKNESKAQTKENSIGMTMVRIPAGTFVMGSPEKELHRVGDETQHEVVITKPFLMSAHEATQEQYHAIMGNNPSYFSANGGGKQRVQGKDTAEQPVERVTWHEAVEFCKKLSAKEKKPHRLPTEAEWEYACRAGTKTVFHTGNDFNGNLANINGLGYSSYGKEEAGPFYRRTVPGGEYRPNRFSLYDMHGNVQEWCADWYAADYYKKSPKNDPQGPDQGTERVLRGGAWPSSAKACRSAARYHLAPDEKNYSTGFRVVMDVK